MKWPLPAAFFCVFSLAVGYAADLPPKSDAPSQVCVEVEIAGVKSNSYDCLNQQLGRQAQMVQSIGNVAPVDAASPSVQTGGFNQAALSQQFGQNLGKSPTPYRPPAAVFTHPIAGH